MKVTTHGVILSLGYLTGLGAVAYFAFGNLSYYLTPLIQRPRHPLYWVLKPGGELGHSFGLIGSLMMVVMLGYSLRKRLPILRRLGPLRIWLDYHILLGICGPLFVILHSSFKVGGLVSLSFWSMVAVALSGVLGRFLYRQIPRSHSGDELSPAEAEARGRELTRELVEQLGLTAETTERIGEIATEGLTPDRSLPALLVDMTFGSFFLRRRLRSLLRRHRRNTSRSDRRRLEMAVLRKARWHRRVVLWRRLRELFHYWHVFHKPFALIMYLFMILHVAVAWKTGYGWSGG